MAIDSNYFSCQKYFCHVFLYVVRIAHEFSSCVVSISDRRSVSVCMLSMSLLCSSSILIKSVIYKRYIILKDYKRQFKSVKTKVYKVWQNGLESALWIRSVAGWIAKCISHYRVWWDYKVNLCINGLRCLNCCFTLLFCFYFYVLRYCLFI